MKRQARGERREWDGGNNEGGSRERKRQKGRQLFQRRDDEGKERKEWKGKGLIGASIIYPRSNSVLQRRLYALPNERHYRGIWGASGSEEEERSFDPTFKHLPRFMGPQVHHKNSAGRGAC